MPAVPLTLTREQARRFQRRALLLDAAVPDIDSAIAHHGYIQIDPINICGRIHDHILRNRVDGYREGDLMRFLHGAERPLLASERRAFEHHLPESNLLVAFSLDAWPFLLAAMRQRTRYHGAWSGKLTPREKELASRILGELAQRGPLSSGHIDEKRRSHRQVWGASSLAKTTLQKLFFHGRVLIARRENHRRLYDLPERILPPKILSAPEPTRSETARWLVLSKLRQRRLVTLKRNELPVVADLVQAVAVDGCAPLYFLRSDLPHLEDVPALDVAASKTFQETRLLAPLDPLIYDRKVTAQLWNFAYTWEVYTPAHKRVRGYYALPVLAGQELVGHVDTVANRKQRKLVIVSRSVRRGYKVAGALDELAAFLGLRR
ncbi:MAG: YcaQ family DNA glycosylase [Clostridia bacterium]|nr:YcaQ family DNA glycosylase [Deltaproteobacteria bacterium]